VLVAGKVVFDGTLPDLMRDPKSGAPRNLETALQRLYQSEAA
jgi:ABC-2 type transport system ATP-binding protein